MPGTLIIIYVFMLAPLFRVSQEVDLGHHQPGTRSRCWLAIREKSASQWMGIGNGRKVQKWDSMPSRDRTKAIKIDWMETIVLFIITYNIN